jgi:hypothetical protein
MPGQVEKIHDVKPSSFDPPRQANLVKVLMPNQAYLVLVTKPRILDIKPSSGSF